MRRTKLTRQQLEDDLNQLGCNVESLKSMGGRIPDRMEKKYGSWLRRNDPIAFEVELNERRRKETGGI